jgi:asparagine synthase (glutamine-hydrolysing)
VDPDAVNLFLRYRFTPSPHTIIRGIKKLAPGSMLVCEDGQADVRQWYKYRPTPFSPPKSTAQAEDELLELYKQSMKRHLLSDVPVGLLLSGGVDSGLLLALMNLYGKSWKTYTVGYGSSFADDELADAERTASCFSSDHTSVTLDQKTFEDCLPAIVSQLEEPIASSSIVPMYFVCQRARRDVKVALVGQGPDELFGGYKRHLGVRYSSYWRSIPAWMRAGMEAAISALPRNETLKRGLYSLNIKDRAQRYQQVLSLLPGSEINALFRDGMLQRDAGDAMIDCWHDLLCLSQQTDGLGGFQFLEMRSTLPDELLMYADKLSMAHSLEVRVPFLDREIVEYAERLPETFKVRFGAQKWLHRKVCKSFLPPSILRRKKRGFAVNVVDGWFRGAMSSKMTDVVADPQSKIYHYLQQSSVQMILRQHQSGEKNHYKILFSLMAFEQWLRANLSGPAKVSLESCAV